MELRKTSNYAFSKQLFQLMSNFSSYGRHKLLWVGDSHAAYMRQGLKKSGSDAASIHSLVYWLGPRLMYSVSKSGFPTTLLFRTAMRAWNPRTVIVSLGEIDVRMFLHDPKLRDASWLREYLFKVDELRIRLNLDKIYLLTCIPVSDLPPNDAIERRGSLEARLAGFKWLQNEILNQINSNISFAGIRYLDLNNCVGDDRGCLNSTFTDDGIHVNEKGAKECWRAISAQT